MEELTAFDLLPKNRFKSLEDAITVLERFRVPVATFDKNERVDLSFREEAVSLTEERFVEFHPDVADDRKFYEKVNLSMEL